MDGNVFFIKQQQQKNLKTTNLLLTSKKEQVKKEKKPTKIQLMSSESLGIIVKILVNYCSYLLRLLFIILNKNCSLLYKKNKTHFVHFSGLQNNKNKK